MFFNILEELCKREGIKLTPLLRELNISKGAISRWRAGTLPNGDTLVKIADYFNCSVDYLLGRADIPQIYSSNVIHTGDITGNNANISLKATSDIPKTAPLNDTSELVELIESLSLVKRAEAIIYLNSLKEK